MCEVIYKADPLRAQTVRRDGWAFSECKSEWLHWWRWAATIANGKNKTWKTGCGWNFHRPAGDPDPGRKLASGETMCGPCIDYVADTFGRF